MTTVLRMLWKWLLESLTASTFLNYSFKKLLSVSRLNQASTTILINNNWEEENEYSDLLYLFLNNFVLSLPSDVLSVIRAPREILQAWG